MPKLAKTWQVFPAVYLAGPRQSGKTTLVKRVCEQHPSAQYFSFDDLHVRHSVKQDPSAFLRALPGPVVLDEVQLVPEIFRPLKIMIDENRSRDDGGRGRFLLTGSAHVRVFPDFADASVGRMALCELHPLSACEVLSSQVTPFVERVFSWQGPIGRMDMSDFIAHLEASTFPELLTLQGEMRRAWCSAYLNTLLQREVRDVLLIDKLEMLPRLLHLMASRVGGVLHDSTLARDMGLNQATVKKYRFVLQSLFMVLSVPAWSGNWAKRLVKSPKVYLGDLNLLLYLLKTDCHALLSQEPARWGAVLENAVAIELSKQISFASRPVSLYHCRTSDGQEIDFILEGPEVKSGKCCKLV